MYIPEFNRIEDQAAAIAFMRANPFAILVSDNDDTPFATHLPVIVAEASGQIIVRAHVAKANPHWKMLEQQDSLVIFHGPHRNKPPPLYETPKRVHTWNYRTAHAYGRGKIVAADTDKHQVLAELISQFDWAYL